MMHSHNHSTLLGYKRKAVYYPPTGTGRDSYIMTDNGGTNNKYTCQGVPQLGNYMKFGPTNRSYKPASYTRFQKYTSDGSGRDKYVVQKHGGQYNQDDQRNLVLIKFRNTMRIGGWKKNTTRQSWRSASSVKKDLQIGKTQTFNTRRLSAPKRVVQKYQQKLKEYRNKYLKQVDIDNEQV